MNLPFKKNSLRGFAEVELPSGMVLKDLTWHQRDDKEWIGLAARKFEKEDGTTAWSNLVDFVDKAHYWEFCKAVLHKLSDLRSELSRGMSPLSNLAYSLG